MMSGWFVGVALDDEDDDIEIRSVFLYERVVEMEES